MAVFLIVELCLWFGAVLCSEQSNKCPSITINLGLSFVEQSNWYKSVDSKLLGDSSFHFRLGTNPIVSILSHFLSIATSYYCIRSKGRRERRVQ